jgi:hypothetical protein
MQVVSCDKRNTGDALDRGLGEISQFEDKQTEEWDIVVDVAGASSAWIVANAPLPNFNSAHPDNPNLRCTGEYQIRRVDGSPIHFQATVTYQGPPAGSALPDPELEDRKPEKRDREPYSEEWSTAKSQEQIDVDVNGDPIVTVNGEQFDPPISEDVHDVQVVYGKNVIDRNQTLIDAAGCTNSDPFLQYAPGQCMIDQVSFKYFTDPDTGDVYWRQTVTILIRRAPPGNPGNLLNGDLWKKRIRAEGYKVKVAGDETPRNAKDGEGNSSAVPVLHDTATGELIEDPAQAQWYYFKTRGEVAFQPLKIN